MNKYEIISLIINGLIMLTGFSAIVIYKSQQRDKKKTAATLILEQIDSIEKTVEELKEEYCNKNKKLDDNSLYLAKEIIVKGAWDDFQYLMLKDLSQSEFAMIQKFFDSTYRIEMSRADIIHVFKANWENISMTTNLIRGKFNDPTYKKELTYRDFGITDDRADLKFSSADLIDMFCDNNNKGRSFTPKISYDVLYAELNNYSKISGTSAYAKLEKMSYRKI